MIQSNISRITKIFNNNFQKDDEENLSTDEIKIINDLLHQPLSEKEALQQIISHTGKLGQCNSSKFGMISQAQRYAILYFYIKFTGKQFFNFIDVENSFIRKHLSNDELKAIDINSGKEYFYDFMDITFNHENLGKNQALSVEQLKKEAFRLHEEGTALGIHNQIFYSEIVSKLMPAELRILRQVNYKLSKDNILKSELSATSKSIHNRSEKEINELIEEIGSDKCKIIELNLDNLSWCNETQIPKPVQVSAWWFKKPEQHLVKLDKIQILKLALALERNNSIKILHLNKCKIIEHFNQLPESITHLYLQDSKLTLRYFTDHNNWSVKNGILNIEKKVPFIKKHSNLKYLDLSNNDKDFKMACNLDDLKVFAKSKLDHLRIKGYKIINVSHENATRFNEAVKPEEIKLILLKDTKLKIDYN